MRPRVFLDTNVFIFSFETPESNSRKVISLLNEGKIEGVVSERVLKEVIAYFRKYHSRDLAFLFREYLLEACSPVMRDTVLEKMKSLKGKIKEKDLEQLATVKALGLKFLVSLDRDFEEFEEYLTPKRFIQLQGMKPSETDF